MRQAQAAFNAGNYANAIKLSQDVTSIEPGNAEAKALIARAEAEQQKLQEQQQQNARLDTLLAQAKSELNNAEFDKARATVKQLLALDPNHTEGNNLIVDIELQQRAKQKEEEKRLREQPIQHFEASAPPQLKGKLVIDIRKVKQRIPRDFKSQLKKLEEKRSRIPVRLLISETGSVMEAKLLLPGSDKAFMDRFGLSDEIENQLKTLSFTPAIKDGLKRRCYINISIPW